MVNNAKLYQTNILDVDHPLKLAIFNCTSDITSDLGSYAVNNTDADFAVIWRYNHTNEEYYYSLRSKDGKSDVSKICELFGGGRHKNASGGASKLHPKDLFKFY